MPEEVGVIINNLRSISSTKFGDLELFSGELFLSNHKRLLVTVGWSGWGKVSAARATTRLLSIKYNEIPIDLIIFTGVAGAVNKKLKQWDIVIDDSLIQHDMDARPIYDKFVIPALNNKIIISEKILINNLCKILSKKLKEKNLEIFGSIYKGLVATGDKFISDKTVLKKLSSEIKGLLAVEMEGGAFAQVAQQENVDWLVLRVISDSANEEANLEFKEFLSEYKLKSFSLLESYLSSLFEGDF